MSVLLRQIPISRRTCGIPTNVDDKWVFGREEAGTLWLWVWPNLLGWPHEITWLFSPVVGRYWPGDLWGIDEAGNLLIVEAKLGERTGGADPFQDFVKHAVPVVGQLAASLRQRWCKYLAMERDFIRDYASALREGRLVPRCYPGVVPYSIKRREVRRWRHLYLDHLVPLFGNEDYERRVEANLRLYERAGGPPPHYIGLFTLLGNGRSALSEPDGWDNYRKLIERPFGADHLHMFAVQAREVGESCEIQSYAVHCLKSNSI